MRETKAIKMIKRKISQYKNLILLVVIIVAAAGIIASDPLGCLAQRRYDRAALRNQTAIERAETEKQIAIIDAEKEAEVRRIEMGACMADAVVIRTSEGESRETGSEDEGRIIWLIIN